MYASVLARKVFQIRTASLETLLTNIDKLIPDIWFHPISGNSRRRKKLTSLFYPFQVGNAVPPPLARAIGLEIRKCVFETDSKKKKEPLTVVEI